MRELAIKIATRFLGTPYKWGGNNPIEGFDCSGFIIEILKSCGKLPEKGDWTADDLSKKFKRAVEPKAGDLFFYDWNGDGKIDHLEMLISDKLDDEALAIAARDGDQKVTNQEEAAVRNAYVKIRPLRPGWIKVVDPFD